MVCFMLIRKFSDVGALRRLLAYGWWPKVGNVAAPLGIGAISKSLVLLGVNLS